MPSRSKLEDLIALAQEPSSERRRELLRGVTDLFFASMGAHGANEMALFDGVLTKLAEEMEEEVRAELSARFEEASQAPAALVRQLAADESIAVAGPVLARSPSLSQADLLHVAQTRGQAHLRVLSGRPDLSEAVAETVVERGDDETVGVLLRNAEAPLSRKAAETVVDRAVNSPGLHQAVVDRQGLPVDLLNEMYFVVEARLRERILARNAEIDPAELEHALANCRNRLALRDGALPPDYEQATARVAAMRAEDLINPTRLATLLRHGERTVFLVAVAEASETDFSTVARIIDNREFDGLAILCKVAGFDRALFTTFVVLLSDGGKGLGVAETYGRLYGELSREAALRTLRFWRMRRQIGDVAATPDASQRPAA